LNGRTRRMLRASFSITDASIVLELSNQILAMAKAAGADCIATACPLCQLNLDMRQKDIEARFGRQYQMPVFYFTQCWAWRWAAGGGAFARQSGGGAAGSAGAKGIAC